ncbi:protein kinase family protein, partial [Amycolatopsis magusensis]
MTTLASHREPTAPTDLLSALRAARAAGADALAATLDEHGLQALDGGRNNDVFAWAAAPTPICIKLYKKTDRRRVEREWHGLTHAAGLGSAPEPLWLDEDPEQPALGMTLLPGSTASTRPPAPLGAHPHVLRFRLASPTYAEVRT